MSTAFLTTTPGNTGLRIAVEIAWGASLADLTGASWTWTDVTADVMLQADDKISITLGRPDFSQVTQTADMKLKLDNRSGAYSEGGLSANWPNVKRGVPIRVRVSADSGTTWTVRFQGNVVGFTPTWDKVGRWATVEVDAAGPLRRLDQGTLPVKSVFRRYMNEVASESVLNYWPCEDPATATQLAPDFGTSPITYVAVADGDSPTPQVGVPSTVSLASSNTGFPGCNPLPAFPSQNTKWNGNTVNNASEAGWTTFRMPFPSSSVRQVSGLYDPGSGNGHTMLFGMGVHQGTDPQDYVRCVAYSTGTGNQYVTDAFMCVIYWPDGGGWPFTGGSLMMQSWVFQNNTSSPFSYPSHFLGGLRVASISPETPQTAFQNIAARPFRWRLAWTGSTMTLGMLIAGTSTEVTHTASISINPLTAYDRAWISPGYINGGVWNDPYVNPAGAFGHYAYHSAAASLTPSAAYISSQAGETVLARMTRLCAQNSMPLTILNSAVAENASITDTMGAQHVDTLSNLLRECELTGQGLLCDGIGLGLTYITKEYRETAANAATLTIDASAAGLMEPFAPISDDDLTINDVVVTRPGGATVQYTDVTGTRGVNAVGLYSTSLSPNCATDTNLIKYAQWAVNIGTEEGYRYPTISFALHTNPSLIPGWLACTPASRVDVTNITAIRRQHPDYPIRLLLEGWQEELAAFEWTVTANTSPADPWNVVVLAGVTGSTGDGICHLDTDGSQLNASVSAGATSIAVKTNSGPLWVTTTGDADSFPFDIDIGGVRATVTAISGATSPQTFTLAAGLPRAFTGSATVGAGVPIKVWRPPVFGL